CAALRFGGGSQNPWASQGIPNRSVRAWWRISQRAAIPFNLCELFEVTIQVLIFRGIRFPIFAGALAFLGSCVALWLLVRRDRQHARLMRGRQRVRLQR